MIQTHAKADNLANGQPDGALKARKQRALHVLLPEEAIVQLKILAAASRLPVKAFLARLVLSAKPFATAEPGGHSQSR